MQLKAFVVRLWRDQNGVLCGQVSNPLTQERKPFQNSAELWQHLSDQIDPDSSAEITLLPIAQPPPLQPKRRDP